MAREHHKYLDRPWLRHYDREVPEEIEIPDVTMTSLLAEAVRERPDGIAIHYYGKNITYTQFDLLVDRFASALVSLGVKRGDRVAIILPNIPQYPICHWAIMRLGAVVVPVNPLYVERELEHQLRDSEAKVAIVLDLLHDRVEAVKPRLPLKSVVVTSAKDFLPPLLRLLYPLKTRRKGGSIGQKRSSGVYRFAQLLNSSDRQIPEVAVSPHDTAVLLYTGGTTGIAKGAELSHVNLLANVLQARAWLWDIRDGEEVIMVALPLFHSYGMTACHHLAVQSKSTMVLVPRFDALEIMKQVTRLGVTVFPGVPTMYVAINTHPDAHKYNLGSIRTCISGGAALPTEVQSEFERITGGRLVEGYGLSECSPVTHCNPISGKDKPGSIGMPWPSTEARIVDPETGKGVGTGEIGELAVRGPQVMRCYWRNEEETNLVMSDGWLLTGDLTRMDEDGYFHVVDRKKDVILSGGCNVYPREVEEVLFEHPKVKEAAVVGVPDDYFGQRVKAFVVPREDESLGAEEIISFCKGKLAKFKIPREVVFREDLPKSLIGKVLRRVLLEEEAIGTEGYKKATKIDRLLL